jgi:phytoene synthase
MLNAHMEERWKDREFIAEGVRGCKAITRRYGTSYYFATQFFPREVREGIYAAYAFARIPDEIVDGRQKSSRAENLRQLENWRERWRAATAAGGSDDAVMNSIVHHFAKFGIPAEDCEAFLNSMFMDEERSRYETYSELEQYMYGSAGVIGLMVTRIVGYSDEKAFEHAVKLGYAFQLTNFLRDIREDFEDLGRVYMPQDEMRRFGVSDDDISSGNYDERFVEFMKFQIERNRQVYREALPGIRMLARRGRLAVTISYVLYSAILKEIERASYNIYKGRVRTNGRQKLWLSAKALVGVYD